MTTSANVQSTEAIEALRAALMSFSDQVGDALIQLDSEMRRVLDWVEHDRPRHWKNQSRLADERLHEAQQALQRCLMFPKTISERPACAEERQAVKLAQARVAYCAQKVERVRHWKRTLPHEVNEYKGRIAKLKRLVEMELPHAIGVVDQILRRLEEYAAIRVGSAGRSYNDLALVKELWPDKPESKAAPEANGIAAVAPAPASGTEVNETEGKHDA
jgi:hypothetical protein